MTGPGREEMEQRLIELAVEIQARAASTLPESLSNAERAFLLIWELEAQVNNGGFYQYFFNSSGRLSPGAPNALRTIEAMNAAKVVQAALDVMGADVRWDDDDMRRDAVINMGNVAERALDGLDETFYAYPDDLTVLLYAYVAGHRIEFATKVIF